ncbi:hypothetical protein KVR01_000774 [Diaporthe batatas]|uniref:uncharacterized protein n=1 Tax=Diaporthe batatas TaxID=748121 RepID=UPI001D054EF5|nr:uncharacterized protein KVR01_000774 [Diaporthe batatas]KAG8170029.1 hypothetical protein KVR01_000774 [Diaporthe batatas]
MARTRSTKGTDKGAKSSGKDTTTSAASSKYSLPAESENPCRVLILPEKASPDARVVSLTHPRYSKPTRYLVCPQTGAYEFVKISEPKTTPRSWLIEGSNERTSASEDAAEEEDEQAFQTQTAKDADLFIATPIDPLFLALPALVKQLSSPKRMFLSSDDHLDSIAEDAPHLRETLRWAQWRELLESRMATGCDTVEAGDEAMFRLSEEKLLAELLAKARRMSDGGLPASMEDKFVTKALEAPVLGRKAPAVTLRLQTLESSETNGADSGSDTQVESQASAATSATSASEASTAATSVADDAASAIQASPEVVRLQRLRVGFNFICSSYVPPALAAVLKKMLAEGKGKGVDFKLLDDYVGELTKLRQEAMMARSASDYSRKRTMDEEDEDRREKRRKKEEEEKRKKAGESRGVRDLKKVNTSGMKKMSDFFAKKPKA